MTLSKEAQQELAVWGIEFRRQGEADSYRWILDQDGWDAENAEIPHDKGAGLVEATVEAVFMLVSFRELDQGDDPRFEGWMSAFVARQEYGREVADDERGYRLCLAGCEHNVSIFVRQVGELDFEDLREVVDYSVIQLKPVGLTLDDEAARGIVQAIEEDLNYGGDEVKLEWNLHENLLVMELVDLEEFEEED